MTSKNIFLFTIVVFSFIFMSCEHKSDNNLTANLRDKIIGEANQQLGDATYPVVISKDFGQAKGILLYGFDNVPQDIKAEVKGQYVFIPQQNIDGEVIEGRGVISEDGKSIHFQYSTDGIEFSTIVKINS